MEATMERQDASEVPWEAGVDIDQSGFDESELTNSPVPIVVE